MVYRYTGAIWKQPNDFGRIHVEELQYYKRLKPNCFQMTLTDLKAFCILDENGAK